MNLNFVGEIDDIKEGISFLSAHMDFVVDVDGKNICVNRCENGFCVDFSDKNAQISYHKPTDFYRALSLAVDAIKHGYEINISQKPAFETCGIMLDVSRGAVMKVDTVKDFMRRMACMGFNELMLYTEDIYELEGYPYFGYMRGRYTKEELCDMVAYGNALGIETVPCIQTLGHLSAPLRWSAFAEIKDQPDVLMIGEEESYKFIETMIKTVRQCFTSDKIHIGMDEAHGVGLGGYLHKNGYKDRFSILSEHLHVILDICKKYNFKPMMWSDMFFRLGTPDGGYYSSKSCLPENISELIPDGISQVYWDYYNNSESFYNVMIKEHKKMQCPIIFAGGVWVWSGPAVNNRQSFESTIPALKVCKEQGISHVMATIWGDDGAECDYYESLYGLQLFAEYNYDGENAEKNLDNMFKICNGFDADAFKLLDIDDFGTPKFSPKEPDFGELESHIINTSKQVLYQNPLMGFFDKNFAQTDLSSHYKKISKRLNDIKVPESMETLFEYHKQLLIVLESKCDIGIRLKSAYDECNIKALKELSDELKILTKNIGLLKELRKQLWYENNKPFGFEQLLTRMSGVEELTKIAYERVDDFVDKKIERIEELEQERLYYNSFERPHFLEYFSKRIMMPNENEMA